MRCGAPDERVDLSGLDLVHATHSLFDVALVGAAVNDEDQGVVVLDLLHGRLSSERVLEDGVLVELVDTGDGAARVLGVAQQTERLGAVELGLVPLLDVGMSSGALRQRLGGLLGRLLDALSSLGSPGISGMVGQWCECRPWRPRDAAAAGRAPQEAIAEAEFTLSSSRLLQLRFRFFQSPVFRRFTNRSLVI